MIKKYRVGILQKIYEIYEVEAFGTSYNFSAAVIYEYR